MDGNEKRGAKRSKGRDILWRPVGLDCEKTENYKKKKTNQTLGEKMKSKGNTHSPGFSRPQRNQSVIQTFGQ